MVFFFQSFFCDRPTHIFYVNGFMFFSVHNVPCILDIKKTLCWTIFFFFSFIQMKESCCASLWIERLFGILILKFKVEKKNIGNGEENTECSQNVTIIIIILKFWWSTRWCCRVCGKFIVYRLVNERNIVIKLIQRKFIGNKTELF